MKLKALFLFIPLWLISLSLAFWAGGNRTPDTASTISPSQSIEEAAPQSRPTIGDSDNEEATNVTETNSDTELSTEEITPSASSIIADLESAFAIPLSDPSRQRRINSLLRQLAQIDPLKALGYVDTIPSLRVADGMRRDILESWASTDPQAALLWAENQLADLPLSRQNNYLESILRGYAAKDPEAALQYTLSLESDSDISERQLSRLASEVIETQIRNGGLMNAIQTIEGFAEGPLKAELLDEMIDEWARFDPQSAANYLDSLGPEVPSSLKTTLVEEWADYDPQAAAEWLSSLPSDDPAIARSTAEIIREWARYDLTASADWLNSLPASPELDRAVATYTWRAVQEDPGSAMSWAESITNDSLRNRAMGQVAAQWRTNDPGAFETYLETAELSEDTKEYMKNAQPSNRGWGGGRNRN